MQTQLPLSKEELKKLDDARKEVLISGRVFFFAIIFFSIILLFFYKLPSIQEYQKHPISFVISTLFWLSPVVSVVILYVMIIVLIAPFNADINNGKKVILSGIIDKKYITRRSRLHDKEVQKEQRKYTFYFVIDGKACPVDKAHYDAFTVGQYVAIHLGPESGFILNVESDNERFMKTTV